MSTPVNFVLTAFENSILLSTAASIPIQTLALTTDAKITLSAVVPASVLQDTFFFRTDDPITLDASFVYYYSDSSKWTSSLTDLNPKNGTVTLGQYVAGDNVSKDFIRDIAHQLFGTYLGADLFTNEDSVVANINTECDTVATSIKSLLTSIDQISGDATKMTADSAGNKFKKDDSSVSNISRELLNQLITAAPARFVDIKTDYKYNATEDGFYKIPILAGDTITFKLTIQSSPNQTTVVRTGPTTMQVRTYTVILVVA